MRSAPEALRLRSSTVGALSVECIDSSWGFTSLRPEWNSLLRASASDCPFLTWEWLHTWWTHLGGSSRLRIVAVREGDTLVALAPLCLMERRIGFLNRLHMLGTGNAGSDYLDVIVRRGWEDVAVLALTRFASSQNAALALRHLAPRAAVCGLLDPLVAQGWHSSTAADGTCPYIPLAGHTWDSYLATLGSSHRANVRRRINALGKTFETSFETVDSDAARREALKALAIFHEQRYATRGGSTAFTTPALQAFHNEATRRALDRGWLRLFVLRINDAPAAVMYGFMYNRRFYFYQHGFDDRYATQSLGLALMGLSIQRAIEEGADEFDMLWGTESYKQLWTRDARVLRSVHLFPPHTGGRLHHRTFQARRALGSLARRVRTTVRRGTHGS